MRSKNESRILSIVTSIRVIHNPDELHALNGELHDRRGPTVLTFVNAHAVNLMHTNEHFLQAVKLSSVVLRDGIGMSLMMKSMGIKPGLNMNGTDYIPQILSRAVQQNFDIYLLGTESPYNQKAAECIRLQGGRVRVVEDGFQSIEHYVSLLESSFDKDSVVVLAMGMPKQELLAYVLKQHFSALPHRLLIINGGAILDFMGGKISRAPEMIRRLNMEWLYRFLKEPRRLFRRYVIGNVLFMARIVRVYCSDARDGS